jgi:tRNA pseudouridine38-40 synthase
VSLSQREGAPTNDLVLQRWRLDISYDGAAFRGFAIQPDLPTVAGSLRQALGRAARLAEPPTVTCAGRTDAGVHARGQVVHVDLPNYPMGGKELARVLNRQLSPSITVHSAQLVGPDFDARRSATGRTYRYLVWNAPAHDPLLAPIAWHIKDELDLRAMDAAASVLLGRHDFRAFCRRPPGTDPANPLIRLVRRATWSLDGGPEVADAGPGRLLRFEIEASSFCHQMVRSLVGSLVEVGKGQGNAATLLARLRSVTRHRAADPAPPHGLCLVAVDYDGVRPEGPARL